MAIHDSSSEYHLFIDDSGSRDPDRRLKHNRDDSMDCFALGGILIKEEDADELKSRHAEFCARHDITYPLHSNPIRGGRENFGWLKNPEKARAFFPELDEFMVSLPVLGIAAVIDRPGYVARYKEHYAERLWLMCKTAYCILIERAAKYADSQGRVLRVFFEETGKAEDRALIAYHKSLKEVGMPFDSGTSSSYGSLSAADFRRIVMGDTKRRTKETPMIQIADLMLYPMAKAGYDPTYRPYVQLMKAGRLIDAQLEPEDRALLGIKYSCFK
ncbi:DUF3800 domain-containing protein [Neorhizobium sp. SHOUNA12A]|nr:DUF3800 domain-containing protein [Neorhizobium sp. SHOUNA12B]MCJ9668987.1 DUF3800 domain-containing protein [Neorhizobium sp. SHOUNA12B]MCJ9744941.1 DUF3800 domain-containing protein [Neorhizobium sp. SHOUNA12A]